MSKIIRLPQHIINQIAAGEVIEGPSSVVKELIENSIDAGATEITVSLKDGGKSEIKIEDNGAGFSEEDLALAFEPHTTSKLHDISDLSKLETLGFRGEALASIGSVSKVTVETKEPSETNGYTLTVLHGNTSVPRVINRKPGTTITITDLFGKIPARQKFLKSTQTEIRKISSEIIKRVLIHPNIRFKLIHNGKELFDFLPISVDEHDTKTFIHPKRVEEIMGPEESESLIPVYTKAEAVTVGGIIGHPSLAKLNQIHTYIFLNKRPIWDRGIIRSVYAGTNRFVASGNKIPFAIYLTIDPTQVDINVHPQKLEVRFLNPYRVYSDIEHAVRSALETALKKDIIYSSYNETSPESSVTRLRDIESASHSPFSNGSPMQTYKHNKELVEQAVAFSRQLLEPTGSGEELPLTNIHQYMSRYIIGERDDELWIIDQHAAAERIRFEELLNAYEHTDSITSQKLLVPIKISLTKPESITVESVLPLLQKIGFTSEISNNILIVTAVPETLKSGDIVTIIKELIAQAENQNELESYVKTKYEDIIATFACHTSLRANQQITKIDAESFVRKLLLCKNPYSCPHGRPILWKITPSEIDTHFERT